MLPRAVMNKLIRLFDKMTQTHLKILCVHFLFYIIKNVTESRDVYGLLTLLSFTHVNFITQKVRKIKSVQLSVVG